MSSFDWRSFLLRWSQIILTSMSDEERQQLPQEVLESGWLGYPGATDEQIVKAEARLQRQLPPSYREFLKVTNGWRQTAKGNDSFNHKLWSTDEIGGFVMRHPRWIEAFTDRHETADISLEDPDELDDYWNPIGISNDEYFVYGEEQDPSKIRIEYLRTAVEISDVGIDSIYLLNPQVVNSEGEWEAWFFADYLPGADRYPSFREMMEAEYANFLEFQETETSETKTADIVQALSQQSMVDMPAFSVNVSTVADPSHMPEDTTPDDTPSELTVTKEPITWHSLKRLTIECQSRQKNNQAEYRTVVSTDELVQPQAKPGLLEKSLQHWLQQHLTETENLHAHKVNAAPITVSDVSLENRSMQSDADRAFVENVHPASEENNVEGAELEELKLEISLNIVRLTIYQPSNPLAQIVVCPSMLRQSNQLGIGSLSSQGLFSIAIEFYLAGERLDTVDPQTIFYKARFFAQNRITHKHIALGETHPESLEKGCLTYTATLFNQTLEPGMYRIHVITSLSGASMALGSFELPLLTVT